MSDTKIIDSPTYGEAVWRKLGVMSAFTFDAEIQEDFDAWTAAHPKYNFDSLQVVSTEKNGIFEVWVPLKRDNKEWEYKGRTVLYQSIKKGDYPGSVSDAQLIKWFKKAERFMIEVNDDIIDTAYDEVEKQQHIKEATKTSKPITTKQYPAKKGTK